MALKGFTVYGPCTLLAYWDYGCLWYIAPTLRFMWEFPKIRALLLDPNLGSFTEGAQNRTPPIETPMCSTRNSLVQQLAEMNPVAAQVINSPEALRKIFSKEMLLGRVTVGASIITNIMVPLPGVL